MKTMKLGLLTLAMSMAALTARADVLSYAAIDGGDFGTLDLTTGVYTQMSVFPSTLAGLAAVNGALYGAPLQSVGQTLSNGGSLYKINPTNGAYTTVGTSSVAYYDFGSTLTGLYTLDSNGNLYSINTANGAIIKDIGNVGLGTLGYGALSDNSGTLYLINAPSSSVNVSDLYSVNTATGALTLISSSVTGNEFTSLLTTNGTLYGVDGDHSSTIYTLNPTTGAEGPGLAVQGESGAGVYGLAPNPVPLPRSVILLLSGLAVFVAVGRRRRPDAEIGLQAA